MHFALVFRHLTEALVFPTQDFEGVSVRYITMKGWCTAINECKTFEELPENAKNYVLKVEELLGVPGENNVLKQQSDERQSDSFIYVKGVYFHVCIRGNNSRQSN